jgi:hypothetical protein
MTAAAADQIAPPGNSAVSEYRENIPGAGGNQPTSGGRRGGESNLSGRARRALQSRGAKGVAVINLAAATGPGASAAQGKEGSGQGEGGTKSAGGGGDGGSGPINVLKHAAGGSDDGGMGAALPLILVASGGGALLLFLRRRLT